METQADNQQISSAQQFEATIVEVYSDGNFVVEPNENELERRSSDKISVKGNANVIWEVGMKVIVTYTGGIMESYPAQINTVSVEIINE